ADRRTSGGAHCCPDGGARDGALGRRLLRGHADLVLCILSTRDLIDLEDVHRLADRRQHQHTRPTRHHNTGTERAHPQQQYNPPHRHDFSPPTRVLWDTQEIPSPTSPVADVREDKPYEPYQIFLAISAPAVVMPPVMAMVVMPPAMA